MKNRDPKPEVLRIEELVKDVKTGDIKLPKFQRPFVWKKSDILKLLDSIYRGYPIGSILLWLTKEKLASERRIGDLDINERPDEYPTNYLLDGQQRLSALCGALFWDGADTESIWNIVFDVENEVFLYPKKETKVSYYPLNKLIDTRDFVTQCRSFDAHPKKDEYYQNSERLLSSIKDYRIAAVRIGDMKLNEVAPIFERINSSGRQLTMVDLMRAATWKGGFDLSDAIKEVREACEAKHFEDIKELHILRSISAAAGNGIHKEDIDKLRDCSSDDLKKAAVSARDAYTLAVDFLTSEFPLTSISYLPYGLQLTLLVEFFNLNSRPSAKQREWLKKWFWTSSFTRYFSGGNTGLITKSLAEIREFARGEEQTLIVPKDLTPAALLRDNFILNKANSLTFALLLASRNPRSFLDGAPVNTQRALAYPNRLEYHHIFPKAYLKKLEVPMRQIDYHLNISMINLSDNREILDSKPSDYFKKMEIRLGDQMVDVMKSHFINEAAIQCAKNDDYEGFITEREKELSNEIAQLSKYGTPVPPFSLEG